MPESRTSLLVAIEPVVLEGAFAAILELIGVDEIVEFHRATGDQRAATYRAAIVSHGLSDAVRADVVITLPGMPRSAGPTGDARGQVTRAHVSQDVDIRGEQEIIDLLDEHVPVGASRRSDLLTAHRSTG